ncbi:hypothetical protein K2173_019745 [Erythroxylum novogranatense]|uniref:Uncharacterized protein n=1 Tax=Erythroxylum novogranatense TaxID=1862640 RepID=A0AAV8SMX1_9ROSI|nr:hypothetical protein K2173_019745 [Erythroxylum novogranatense]
MIGYVAIVKPMGLELSWVRVHLPTSISRSSNCYLATNCVPPNLQCWPFSLEMFAETLATGHGSHQSSSKLILWTTD